MIAKRLLLPFVLIALTTMVGCQGPSYVNIPAEKGDVAFNKPNGRTVRAVVATAVDTVVADTPLEGPVALTLPPRTEILTYESIADITTAELIPAPQQDEGEAPAVTATLQVTRVAVRGHKSEVDIIRAKAEGAEQLVTVYGSWNAFEGWRVNRIRAWRINPNQPY